MVLVIENTPPNVIGVLVDGQVTKDDYDKIKPLLRQDSGQAGGMRFFVDLRGMTGFTAAAL